MFKLTDAERLIGNQPSPHKSIVFAWSGYVILLQQPHEGPENLHSIKKPPGGSFRLRSRCQPIQDLVFNIIWGFGPTGELINTCVNHRERREYMPSFDGNVDTKNLERTVGREFLFIENFKVI